MSHRITTKTEVKDKKIALAALNKQGWTYYERGEDMVHVTSGPLSGATINTKTGEISGDTDIHRRGYNGLEALNQPYSEALVTRETVKQGGVIEQRSVDQKSGDVILIAQFG